MSTEDTQLIAVSVDNAAVIGDYLVAVHASSKADWMVRGNLAPPKR